MTEREKLARAASAAAWAASKLGNVKDVVFRYVVKHPGCSMEECEANIYDRTGKVMAGRVRQHLNILEVKEGRIVAVAGRNSRGRKARRFYASDATPDPKWAEPVSVETSFEKLVLGNGLRFLWDNLTDEMKTLVPWEAKGCPRCSIFKNGCELHAAAKAVKGMR